MMLRKRIAAALLPLLILAMLCACSEVPAETVIVTPEGATPSPVATAQPAPSPSAVPQDYKVVVHSGDAWGDYGYVHFLCPMTAQWSFTSLDSGDINWKIYLLDAEFDDAERFIPQVYECALEGDGTLSITEGQYIYVYCTANSWTGIEATEQARMECAPTAP